MSRIIGFPLKIFLRRLDGLEQKIAADSRSTTSVEDSPVRFEIMRESLKRGKSGPDRRMLKYMVPIMRGMIRSLKPLRRNPPVPKPTIGEEELRELEQYLIDLGAGSVGYTPVSAKYVFQDKGILHSNAIVMSMEMDAHGFERTPSFSCEVAVMEIYRDLGIIANKGADWLRKRGYSAHAGHALMGVALYPALAQLAGLGWIGKSGILITPEHGPRVRLGAMFTNIENLQSAGNERHQWIEDYCEDCHICVKKCPFGAIRSKPVDRTADHISFVETEVCFPQFSDHYGCAVCIGVCP